MEPLTLDRNENLYGPAPACLDALRGTGVEELSLYTRNFLHGTKSALSERLAADTGIPERQILLGNGSEDLLKQAVHCYLRPGAKLLLPEHSWWYYSSVAAEVDGISVRYPLRDAGDRYAYDVQPIIDLYDQHGPGVILIASPNNPTGNSIPAETLEEVARRCADAVIVLDEAYFGFAGAGHERIVEFVAMHPRVIVLRTFSKFFALAGLRIGYAFVGKGLDRLVTYSARYLGFNRVSESIALAALDSTAYYGTMARQMETDREEYYRTLAGVPGLTCYRSDANFVLVRYHPGIRKELEAALTSRGILVKFLNEPGLQDCLRVTLGTQEQNARVLGGFSALRNARLQPSSAPIPVSI
jgi:histidinol-phosphate aminotransferase